MPNGETTAPVMPVTMAPTPEGGYVTIVTDITERKRAEQELAEKEAQLRLALDNMPGAMFMVDEDFNFQVFNDKCSEFWGSPTKRCASAVL